MSPVQTTQCKTKTRKKKKKQLHYRLKKSFPKKDALAYVCMSERGIQQNTHTHTHTNENRFIQAAINRKPFFFFYMGNSSSSSMRWTRSVCSPP